jgi:lipopolysaccharide export system protein LptA
MHKLPGYFLVLSLLSATGVTNSYAQSGPAYKGHDTTQAVETRSDRFFVNRRVGTAEFSGHVVVVQGDLTISSDEMLVEYVVKTEAVTRSVDKLTATGNVRVKIGTLTAKADVVVYSIGANIITLEGNAVVSQTDSIVAGDKITLNQTDDTIHVEGQVQTVFEFGPAEIKE